MAVRLRADPAPHPGDDGRPRDMQDMREALDGDRLDAGIGENSSRVKRRGIAEVGRLDIGAKGLADRRDRVKERLDDRGVRPVDLRGSPTRTPRRTCSSRRWATLTSRDRVREAGSLARPRHHRESPGRESGAGPRRPAPRRALKEG